MKNTPIKLGMLALASLLVASCGSTPSEKSSSSSLSSSSSSEPTSKSSSTSSEITSSESSSEAPSSSSAESSTQESTSSSSIEPEPVKSQLKFAIFADVQLCNDEAIDGAAANLGATANAAFALKSHFQFIKDNKIDVVLMNGDITNQANEYYYQHFESILKSVYGEDESAYPEFVWNMGNHEWWWGTSEKETGDAVSMFRSHARINSANLVKESSVPYAINNQVNIPSYYKVINGIPFLCISAENSSGYVSETLYNELNGWLTEIKQLDSVKKGGPVFVEYHYPLTTSMTHGQGSNSEKCEPVERLLKDTPNAVVFTGDTHFPGTNERAINQVDFTTINLGSSSYSRNVDESAVICDNYDNVIGTSSSKADKMKGNVKFKEAYTPTIQIVDVNNNQTFTIDRYFTDVMGGRSVGKQWTFEPITSKSDFTYTNARFQNKESANALYGADGLSWDADAKVVFGVNDGRMTVRFPEVAQYHFCEHYRIDVNGKIYDEVSNYYKYLVSPEENYYILENVPEAATYTVTITAYDFYDNPSLNTLSSSNNDVDKTIDAIDMQLPNTYTDIQVRNNFGVVSSSSHSSVEFYYKGSQTYKYGAIVGRLFSDDPSTESCKDFVSLTDKANNNPTITMDVKNLDNGDMTFGLSVVQRQNDGSEKWLNDFGKETQKTVSGGEWTTLTWSLKDLFGLSKKSQIAAITLKANNSAATKTGYETNFLVDNLDLYDGEVTPRGKAFEPANNTVFDFEPIEAASGKVVLDLLFNETGTKTKAVIGLFNSGWDGSFAWYDIYSDGSGSYDGVSISSLDDGYLRITFTLNKLGKVSGNTPTEISHLQVRKDWTTGSGYADCNPEGGGTVIRGAAFAVGTDCTKDIPSMAIATDTIVIDLKFTSASDTKIALMFGTWADYFGYFNIYSTTETGVYNGLTVSKLSDGYMRLSFKLSEVTLNSGTAPNEVKLVYIRGAWSTASGYIDINPAE